MLGDGDGDPNLPQKYDHRGRPINPETKRINKDMIRSHNEVMLVIGVAEPEHPGFGLEAELQRRHVAHEDDIAQDLIATSRACMEGVGLLGIGGLRQRILVGLQLFLGAPNMRLQSVTLSRYIIAIPILLSDKCLGEH